MPRQVILVGFGLTQHPQWKARIGPLKPPGNYKKPESIAQWTEEQWTELEKDATSHPLGAKVESVCVRLADGSETSMTPKGLVELLCAVYDTGKPTLVVGYDVYARLMPTLIQLMEQQISVPYWLLGNEPDSLIMFRSVVPAISRVEEEKLFKVINVQPLNSVVIADPVEKAKAEVRFVEALAKRLMFI